MWKLKKIRELGQVAATINNGISRNLRSMDTFPLKRGLRFWMQFCHCAV